MSDSFGTESGLRVSERLRALQEMERKELRRRAAAQFFVRLLGGIGAQTPCVTPKSVAIVTKCSLSGPSLSRLYFRT